MKPVTDSNSAIVKQMKTLGTTFTLTTSMSPSSKVFNVTAGSVKVQSMVDQEITKIFATSSTRPSSGGRSPLT